MGAYSPGRRPWGALTQTLQSFKNTFQSRH